MLISVIVTTYNRPDALALVLQGLQAQSDSNFEVIIADDGSTSATRSMIEQFQFQRGSAKSPRVSRPR